MRVVTLIMCTHARAYITNNKLKLQISYARLIFFKRTGRKAVCFIKDEKVKDGHTSTIQRALARQPPK